MCSDNRKQYIATILYIEIQYRPTAYTVYANNNMINAKISSIATNLGFRENPITLYPLISPKWTFSNPKIPGLRKSPWKVGWNPYLGHAV